VEFILRGAPGTFRGAGLRVVSSLRLLEFTLQVSSLWPQRRLGGVKSLEGLSVAPPSKIVDLGIGARNLAFTARIPLCG